MNKREKSKKNVRETKQRKKILPIIAKLKKEGVAMLTADELKAWKTMFNKQLLSYNEGGDIDTERESD